MENKEDNIDYDCIVESKLASGVSFSNEDVDDLAQSVGLTLEPRDYQKRAIAHAISNKQHNLAVKSTLIQNYLKKQWGR